MQAGRTIEVLCGLDLRVPRGETLAILGASGSGKSTLLSLLAGLDAPSSGSIAVAGERIEALDEAALAAFRARAIGIVFQQFHLLRGATALENVALPLELAHGASAKEASIRAAAALASVGLAERATHRPHELSGGECQRVAIARALVVEPAILLADEPSGSLDRETGGRIVELLFDLVARAGTTLVLVTHEEGLARRCGRALELTGGRLEVAG